MERQKRTGGLELKCALVAFHNVTGRHDGVNLANIIMALLDRVGVTAKVSGSLWTDASFEASCMIRLGTSRWTMPRIMRR
jgi:hypothetical protein